MQSGRPRVCIYLSGLILCHYRHGVGLGYLHRRGFCVVILLSGFLVVAYGKGSNGTDTHPFLLTLSQWGIGDIYFHDAAMKATDRHKLIDRINTLEGLADDERSALLGLLRETKTYGLVWEDKPEDVEERLCDELPVLIEDKERALTNAGPDAPNHILIEGGKCFKVVPLD